MDTPHSYAAHLATYIASPLKIEKLVALEFDYVPPLHEIAELRYQVEKAAKRGPTHWSKDSDTHDGDDFVVPSLLPKPVLKPTIDRRRRLRRSPWTYRAPKLAHVDRPVPPIALQLIDAVAADFECERADIMGRERYRLLVAARAVVCRILRERGWSFPRIGAALDGRDHSTVIHLHGNWDTYAATVPMATTSYERNQHFARRA